jgi:hypothetical protein
MESIYNEQNTNKFFEGFKTLKNSYNIEKVHQLLANPDAKATHRVNFYSKHLKIIIMVSTVLITISTFLFKLSPGSNLDVNSNKKNMHEKNIQPKTAQVSLAEKPLAEKSAATFEYKLKESNNTNKNTEEIFAQVNTTSNLAQEPINNVENKKENTKTPQTETQNCNWPSDTIIDKKNLLVELSDSELFELGIVKNGIEVLYNNKRSTGEYLLRKRFKEEKMMQTNFEFLPYFITSKDYVPNLFGIFLSSIDTMVPVIIHVGDTTIPAAKTDDIWWFNPHETLFEKLPSRYKYLKEIYSNLKCIKRKYRGKSFTNYLPPNFNNTLTPVNYIILDKDELRQIGVNITQGCLITQFNDFTIFKTICAGYHTLSFFSDSLNTSNIIRISKTCAPIIRTDLLGRKIEVIEPENQKIVEKYSNILIPIKIDLYQLLDGMPETQIWWYYPSDEFIQLLPDRIKHELKLERDAIISNQKVASSTCTYFEACRSTLDTKLSLFPNPAKTSVTLEFESSEDMTGSISLVNISGAVVKQLLPSAFIRSGKNSFNLELSGIRGGIYLVYLNTNKGFVTQKLIVN